MVSSWKTVRVFISSTFRDMHAERDHLVKVVFPKLRQRCEQRRLHLVDIDLRWGVTEAEANNGKAIDICLKEIDGSRPFFVCILGDRYGFVPERLPEENLYRFTGLQAVTHKSITHLEIMHAIEQPLPRLKPPPAGPVCPHSFFYFRNSECLPKSKTLTEHLSPKQLEEYEKSFFEPPPRPGELDRREQLMQLKEDIRRRFQSQGRVFEYECRFDPTANNVEDDQLKGRLTDLDAFGNRIETDLTRAIEAQFTEHIRAASMPVDPLVVERSLHEAFIENRTQVYVPRVDIEHQLTDYLHANDDRPLVLSGSPGSGKSAILAHWVKENVDRATWIAKWDGTTFVISRFIGASPSSTNLARLLRGICEELTQHFDLQEEIEVDDLDGTITKHIQTMEVPQDPDRLLSKWPKFLEAATEKGPLLLILDGVNQLDRSTDPLWLFWLPHKLPMGMRLIISVLDHGQRSDPRSTADPPDWLAVLRRREIRETPIQALNEFEQIEIIRELPSVFCKTLDPELIRVLVRNQATTNPLFLIVALEELRVFGGFKTLVDKIAQLPQLTKPVPDQAPTRTIDDALDELFGQVLDRLDGEAKIENLVPTMFRLMASAREGLTEGELQELLARLLPTADVIRRNSEMQVVLRQVRRYLMQKGPLLDFYHRSFWKAVRARYSARPEERTDSHRQIAAFFAGQEYYRAGKPNDRKVIELAWQHLRAGEEAAKVPGELVRAWDPLADLLTDIEFLEAKAEAGLAYDLGDEYSQAVAALGDEHPKSLLLKLLWEMYLAEVHTIAQRPSLLLQSLWNHGYGHDDPEIGRCHGVAHATGMRWKPAGLTRLLESWRQTKKRKKGKPWLRDLWPPRSPAQTSLLDDLNGDFAASRWAEFSPDGSCLAVAYDGNFVRLWDWARGVELHRLQDGENKSPGEWATCVVFSQDGATIASGSSDNIIRVWDSEKGVLIRRLEGHGDMVYGVAFSPDGATIASASNDKSVRLWDVATGTELRLLEGHRGWVYDVAFSQDGAVLATASQDKTVRVWDVKSGAELFQLQGHENEVFTVAFGPRRENWLASSSADQTIRIWNLARRTQSVSEKLGELDRLFAFGEDVIHVVRTHWNSRQGE